MVGFTSDIKLGVYAYLSSEANTTVTTGGTFELISGTFVNDPIEGFSLGTNEIVYNCVSGMSFEIDWHASFSSGDAGRTVHFGVSVNGETLSTTSEGVVGTFAKNAGQTYTVSGTRVVTLNQGDTVQLQLTSDTDADVITVKYFTTTISKFFRGGKI